MSSIGKKSLKISAVFAAGVLGVTTLTLNSCSTLASESDTLIIYNSNDALQNNNSPLNSSFENQTISSYAKSEMLNLLDYQTVGQFKFSGDSKESITDTTTHDFLELSGASALIIFDNDTSQSAFDAAKNINTGNQQSILEAISQSGSSVNGLVEGQNFWIFLRSKGAIQYQNGPTQAPDSPLDSDDKVNPQTNYYSDAVSKGTVYQFIIDTDNQWLDSSGNTKGNVSSKDFERAIEAYYLSSDLGYNRNGYFLDLLGLNPVKTLESSSNSSGANASNFNIVDPNFDTEDYASTNDAVFTIFLNSSYAYTNDLLSKDYFAALPHANQKVKNITLKGSTRVSQVNSGAKTIITYKSNQYPIVYTDTTSTSSNSHTYSIDETNTDWNSIFGSGGVPYFMQDTWFAGPYYISNFSTSKIIFKLNTANSNTVGKYLLDYTTAQGYDSLSDAERKKITEQRISTITYVYGSGTPDVFYQMFKSNQLSYVSSVPDSYKSEAAQLFGTAGALVPIKTVKTAQSNYIVYTPNPYVLNDNGNAVVNSYITENFAKFDYDWTSQNSMTIRAAINGLINYYQLSLINLQGSGDFQLSATPFGAFDGYYQSVANSSMYGGLPRPYSDYINNSGYILGGFQIPYYQYTNSGIELKQLPVNQDTLKSALQAYGATQSNPLIFSYKMGESSLSNSYQSYLNTLSQQIDAISGGLIAFKLNQRTGSNPTATEWYNQQESPLGFSYWAPDYNGVGTWIEADTTLQSNGGIEAVPSTNAHNSYITFLSALVTVVNLTNASFDGSKYTIGSASGDPFANDQRIQAAFGSSNFIPNGSWSSDVDIQDSDSAGIKYAKLAIGLLNELIKENVFNQSAFDSYVKNPSKLSLENNKTPTNADDVYLGHDVINSDESANFSKYLGIYAGTGSDKALFETVVLDSDYSFIPRSEAGLNEFIYTLASTQFQPRSSSVTPLNYRDFSKK